MNNSKLNILLLVPSISSGGAERVMVHLFNHLSRDKFEIHLAVLHKRETSVDNFREDIEHFYNLHTSRARNAFFPLLKFIRALNPDVILSAMPALNLVLSLVRPFIPSSTKFIMRETSIPSKRKHDIPRFLYQHYYRQLIPKNDLIICQGSAMADDLKKCFKIPEDKLTIIHNPIDYEKINRSMPSKEHFEVILIAGLRSHKGVHRLIEATQYLDPSITIGIIGSGPEENRIKQMIRKKNFKQIKMLGFQAEPVSYMRAAKVVVQTSYYEGFSNVLLESLAVGTPVVAFDVPGGTNEIIDHGDNGYLVEDGDIEGFAKAIQKAISIDWNRDLIKSNTYEKYNIEKIISEYEEAIYSVISLHSEI